MKKVKKLLIFSTLFITFSLKASSLLFASNLPYKEGVINYSINGNKKGLYKIYFKDYGSKIAIYEKSKVSILFDKKEINQLTIIDKKYKTTIDLKRDTATLSPSQKSKFLDIFSDLNDEDKNSILNTPSINIANLECQIVESDGIIRCLNGSIPLLTRIDIFGYHEKIVATDIKSQEVDDRYFKVPDNLEVVEKDIDNIQASKIITKMLE